MYLFAKITTGFINSMYNYGVGCGFEAKLQYRFGKKNIREAVAGASGSIGLSTRLRV